MEIKNINTNKSKNLQLISTYGENNQHKYMDLLEFKYNIDGNSMTVRDIIEKMFIQEEENKALKKEIKSALTLLEEVQKLHTKTLDLLDSRTIALESEIKSLKNELKILLN